MRPGSALALAALALVTALAIDRSTRARRAAGARVAATRDGIRRFNARCDASTMELDASPARPERPPSEAVAAGGGPEIMSAPPHVLVRDDRGLASWRPVLTTLSVHGVAQDHNARHLVVREGGVERFRFRLDADHAAHLSRRLAPSGPEAA